MEKILDDYFKKSEVKVRVCDSPEEIAETLKLNEKMKMVQRQFRNMSARSRMRAKDFYFTR